MNELLTVKQFGEKFKWPTVSAMRGYIYRKESYGLEKAFFKVGKRVLVDPEIFFNLIRNLNESST